jgi:hypothetical protein
MYRDRDRLYAYFAGVIDSDGFISIQKSVRTNKSSVTRQYYHPKVGFTSNNNAAVQVMLKDNFGGSIYTYKPRNPNYRAWGVWQVSDKHTRDVLVALLPFLLAKKRQAELVIEFIDLCDRQWREMKQTQKVPYHVTDEMLALREDYWKQVSDLNSLANRKLNFNAVTAHYSPSIR